MLTTPSLTPLLDYGSPVNWRSPLNRGLLDWWRVLPKRMGMPRWTNLARPDRSATLVSMSPSSSALGWSPQTHPGGKGSVLFDGAGGYVTVGVWPVHDFANQSFTLLLWCRATTQFGYIVNKRYAGGGGVGGWMLRVDSAGTLTARVLDDNNTPVAGRSTLSTTHLDGTWRFLAIVFTTNTAASAGNNVDLYVNGQPDGGAQDTTGGVYVVNTLPLVFGNASDLAAGNSLVGALDDIRLVNYGLSAAEVRAAYAAATRGWRQALTFLPAFGAGPNSLSRSSVGSASQASARLVSNVRASAGSASTALSRSVGLQVPALVAWTSAANTNTFDVTTPAITTTGATFLVIAAASWAFTPAATPSDSRGHTWTSLTAQAIANDPRIQLWYVANATGGAGHTFTYPGPGGGDPRSYCSIIVAAFSGVRLVSPLDGQAGTSGAAVASLATGAVTPTQAGDLLLSALAQGAASASSVSGGLTILTQVPYGAGFGATLAWRVQASVAASNPTWTLGASANMAVTQGAFKAAPVPLVTTRTSLASGSAGRLASNVRASLGSAQALSQRLASAERMSPAQTQSSLTSLASQATLRQGSALASRQLVASSVRLSTGSQASSRTGIGAASRASLGLASATRTSLLSASTTRSASALGAASGVSHAARTLSLHASALALLTLRSQAVILLGLAQAWRTGSASASRTSAGGSGAAALPSSANVRTSLGQSTALPSASLGARHVTPGVASAQAIPFAGNIRVSAGGTSASSGPRVASNALGRPGGAFSALVPTANQTRTLTGQALTTVEADLSALLVAQGVSVGAAAGMASGVLVRVLRAQGLVLPQQSATLTLSAVAGASRSGLAHAQRHLVGQAQGVALRLASSVLARGVQAWALGLLAPIRSLDVTRRVLAMARVQVLGRMQIGGEWHVVGPGNRRLETIYPRAPIRIYRYPIRRH
jgi:hypothetical protein